MDPYGAVSDCGQYGHSWSSAKAILNANVSELYHDVGILSVIDGGSGASDCVVHFCCYRISGSAHHHSDDYRRELDGDFCYDHENDEVTDLSNLSLFALLKPRPSVFWEEDRSYWHQCPNLFDPLGQYSPGSLPDISVSREENEYAYLVSGVGRHR
jgi:hypothetical protein